MSDRWNGKIKADEFASLQESTAKIMGLRKPVVKESHMKPEIFKGLAYSCDTTNGIEIVPQEVCGKIRGLALPGDALAEGDKNFDAAVKQLRNYLSSGSVMDIELVEGYLARLSAPGYTDSTEWGIYDSVEDAEADLAFMYGDDDDDEMDESKKPVAKEASAKVMGLTQGKKRVVKEADDAKKSNRLAAGLYDMKYQVRFQIMTDVDPSMNESDAIDIINSKFDFMDTGVELVDVDGVEIEQQDQDQDETVSDIVYATVVFASNDLKNLRAVAYKCLKYNDDEAEYQEFKNGEWVDIDASIEVFGGQSKKPIKEADDNVTGNKGYNIPGTNLYIRGFGKDGSGNSVMQIGTPNERSRSLQTGDVFDGNPPKKNYWKTEDKSDVKKYNSMIVDYVKKFMKNMRLKLTGDTAKEMNSRPGQLRKFRGKGR